MRALHPRDRDGPVRAKPSQYNHNNQASFCCAVHIRGLASACPRVVSLRCGNCLGTGLAWWRGVAVWPWHRHHCQKLVGGGRALLHCTGTYCGCGCGPADGPRQDNAKQRGGTRIHIHNPHPHPTRTCVRRATRKLTLRHFPGFSHPPSHPIRFWFHPAPRYSSPHRSDRHSVHSIPASRETGSAGSSPQPLL